MPKFSGSGGNTFPSKYSRYFVLSAALYPGNSSYEMCPSGHTPPTSPRLMSRPWNTDATNVLQLLRQAQELRGERELRIHRGRAGSIQYRLRFGDHVAVGRDAPGVHGGERQGAVQVEPAVREPIAVVHLARVHGVRERTDPGVDDFQRRVPDSLRIPQLGEKNASVFLGGAQPLRDGGDLLVHPFPGWSLPALGGIEARRRRRNAQAVHLRARRQTRRHRLLGRRRPRLRRRHRPLRRRARPGDCGRGKLAQRKKRTSPENPKKTREKGKKREAAASRDSPDEPSARGRVRARGACIHRHGVARVDLAPLGLSFVFVSGDVVVRRHPVTSTESTESAEGFREAPLAPRAATDADSGRDAAEPPPASTRGEDFEGLLRQTPIATRV